MKHFLKFARLHNGKIIRLFQNTEVGHPLKSVDELMSSKFQVLKKVNNSIPLSRPSKGNSSHKVSSTRILASIIYPCEDPLCYEFLWGSRPRSELMGGSCDHHLLQWLFDLSTVLLCFRILFNMYDLPLGNNSRPQPFCSVQRDSM